MVISTRCKSIRLRALLWTTSGKFGTSLAPQNRRRDQHAATSKHAGSWLELEPRSPPALQRLYCTSRIVMVPLGKDCEKSFTLCDKIKGSEMVCAHPPTSSTTVAPAPTECSQCGAPITSTLPASSSRPLHRPPQDNPNGAGSPTSKYSLRCGCGPPLSHHFSQWTPTAHRASGPMISSERAHCDAPRCRRTAIAKVPHEPSRALIKCAAAPMPQALAVNQDLAAVPAPFLCRGGPPLFPIPKL